MRWPVGWADNVPIAGASRTAGYCRRYQRGSPTLRLPYCRVAYPGRIGRSTSSVGVVASHSQRTRWPARGVTTELVRRPQLRRLGAVAGAGSHSAYLSAPSTGFAEQQQRRPLPAPLATGAVAVVAISVFLVALYGGYFGVGIGILMISALNLLRIGNIHRVVALKNLLTGCLRGVAVVVLVFQGLVDWRYGLPMAVGGLVGGYLGGLVSHRANRAVVRWTVIGVGFGVAAYYFWRLYGPPVMWIGGE